MMYVLKKEWWADSFNSSQSLCPIINFTLVYKMGDEYKLFDKPKELKITEDLDLEIYT